MASATMTAGSATGRRGFAGPAKAILVHGLCIFGALWMFVPFAWMIAASFEPEDEIFAYPPTFIPSQIIPQHWASAWTLVPFPRYFFNSATMTVLITAGQFVTATLAAYAFARLRFPGRDRLFLCFLATLMVPGQILLIPQFMIIRTLHWLNTYQALIVPGLASAYSVFLLRQFFLTLPAELEDAARIDGASPLRILWQIVVPLSRPAIVTMCVFTAMGAWNAFLWPLIVTTGTDMYTVQLGLQTFRGAYSTQWSYMMAATCFVTLPILAIFFLGQRYFIEGVALSGLKG